MIGIGSAMYEPNKEQEKHKGQTRAIQNDERRRSLVLAAYQLIAERGLEHLRTRDIAARAGVNIATLHYHFASKEDLIDSVVDYVLQVFNTPPPSIPELASATPWDHIQSMFLSIEERLRATPELFIVLSEFGLRSTHSSFIQPALKKLDEGWSSYVRQVVTDGIKQGQFRADLDPESMAKALIIVLKGAIFHQITSGEALDFAHLLKEVERLLLS